MSLSFAKLTSTPAEEIQGMFSLNSTVSLGDLATMCAVGIAFFALRSIKVAADQLTATHRQLAEAKYQREAQMAQHVFDMLSSKESRTRRRWLYNAMDGVDPASVKPEQWEVIEDIWIEFERVAQYCQSNLVSEKSIIEMYSFAIIVAWKVIEPFANYQALRRGGKGIFLSGFRRLASEAEQYWKATYKETQVPTVVSWIDNYTPSLPK